MIQHTITLRIANREDFLEVKEIINKKRIFKLIFGISYWLKNSKGVITNKSYQTSEHTNLKEFGELIKHKQVFITEENE